MTFLSGASTTPFQLVGWVDVNRLVFTWGNNSYEFVSQGRILKSMIGRVWVWHDPDFIPESWRNTGAKGEYSIVMSNSIESLLPKRK
ncbi:MAG: hypothetical protein FJW20_22980 [Acidimicrobiia bacterium]|nr:hypothetical protein [Acidimicrobiia bacterium]